MIDEANSVFGHSDCLVRRFTCMGSPCEVLIDSPSESLGQILFNKIHNEAKRIEDKYSRYKTHNIVFEINNANGKKIRIDKETERLLKFADKLYYVSGGLFDITSGVLRKAWKFEGQEFEPDQNLISGLLNKVGWSRVKLQGDRLQMPPGAEIDFGGVVKEYAVDCCVGLARNNLEISVLVNFGGDIAVSGPKRNGQYWNIKIDGSDWEIKLGSGAVATSGDKHRFVVCNGKRLSHILNPKTGFPIEGAPRAVTVVAENCTSAGALSTLALLHGAKAEEFLAKEAQKYKILR